MLQFLQDLALSYAPERVRRRYQARSLISMTHAAMLSGVAQMVLASWGFVTGYKAFLVLRSGQYGQVLRHGNVSTQGWFVGVFLVEYLLFHPLGLALFYLAIEGFVRFVAGLTTAEALPSLPIVLAFALWFRLCGRKERRKQERLASIPDQVEVLAGGERLRIASAVAKANWNRSLTIEIRGRWYEVSGEEKGSLPRVHVYLLRPAPAGKILRGYERYDFPV